MQTVFISYHFNDRTFKGEIKKWLQADGVKVISVDESDLRPEESAVVKRRIREDLDISDLVLVLVGDDTHNRPWVDYEVSVAKNWNIPIYWVRLPNRTGAAPKEVRNIPSVRYSRSEITNLID